MAESVVYLLDIVYFLYISKEWVWLQIPNVILCILGIIWIFSNPETPRYLLAVAGTGRTILGFLLEEDFATHDLVHPIAAIPAGYAAPM